jgi:hypothetical protein
LRHMRQVPLRGYGYAILRHARGYMNLAEAGLGVLRLMSPRGGEGSKGAARRRTAVHGGVTTRPAADKGGRRQGRQMRQIGMLALNGPKGLAWHRGWSESRGIRWH